MTWSYRLGRVGGIALDVHLTFGLLLIWAALLGELAFVLLLFGVVVLHELGHAFMASQFGVHTRAITLLPIGGVAQMDGMPQRPQQELLVALAGPAVNMALATALLPLTLAFSGAEALAAGDGLLARLLWVNVGLALFNLLPAFPMDGGRVLRSLLSMRIGAVPATLAATRVGQVLAVAMGVVGLFASPMLALVAVFVWFAAEQEKQAALLTRAFQAQPIQVRWVWRVYR